MLRSNYQFRFFLPSIRTSDRFLFSKFPRFRLPNKTYFYIFAKIEGRPDETNSVLLNLLIAYFFISFHFQSSFSGQNWVCLAHCILFLQSPGKTWYFYAQFWKHLYPLIPFWRNVFLGGLSFENPANPAFKKNTKPTKGTETHKSTYSPRGGDPSMVWQSWFIILKKNDLK